MAIRVAYRQIRENKENTHVENCMQHAYGKHNILNNSKVIAEHLSMRYTKLWVWWAKVGF